MRTFVEGRKERERRYHNVAVECTCEEIKHTQLKKNIGKLIPNHNIILIQITLKTFIFNVV